MCNSKILIAPVQRLLYRYCRCVCNASCIKCHVLLCILILVIIFHCFIKNNAYSCTERILVLFILSSRLYLFGFLNSFYLIINALIVSIPCCICCQCLCIYKYCDSKYRQQMRISFIFHFITIPFNNLQTLNRRHKNSLLQLVTNMLQIVTD